jgi:hypothetical protein
MVEIEARRRRQTIDFNQAGLAKMMLRDSPRFIFSQRGEDTPKILLDFPSGLS